MEIVNESNIGKQRKTNEDCVKVVKGDEQSPVFCAIADGMGGYSYGDLASKMACDYIVDAFNSLNLINLNVETIKEFYITNYEKINKKIYDYSRKELKTDGIGTTLTCGVLFDNKIIIGHVGDSRAYKINKNSINAITTDHRLVEEYIKNGIISREEAVSHPERNILTRAVGYDHEVKVDIYESTFDKDDYILFSTDGLTGMLSDEKIKNILYKNDSLEKKCDLLITESNSNGGTDNISVIIVKV